MIELEKYKSGHFEKAFNYRYFVPLSINDEWIWQASVINSLL